MRSILLAVVFFGMLPTAIVWPEIGIMLWAWVSYMNPHKLTWGFTRNLPLAQMAALVTVAAWTINRQPKRLQLNRTTLLLLCLFLWYGLTTLVAIDRPTAVPLLVDEVKKLLLCGMMLAIIDDRRKLLWLVGVIAVSLGIFGVQGGAFVIATGGSRLVSGPIGSYAADNNCLAVVMVMSVPLMAFFYLQATRPWQRGLIALAVLLTMIAIMGTRSRGGFLALACCLAFLWFKAPRSLGGIVMLLMGMGAALLIMPDEFYQRLSTLTVRHDELDKSAVGRLEAWGHALNIVASRPLVGAGFAAFTPDVFAQFTPDVHPRAAHSVIFQLLGELGIGGLVLYFTMLFSAYRDGAWMVRHARGRPDAAWAGDLGRMLQVCLIGFTIGGAFLSLAHIEPLYGLIVVCALSRRILRRETALKEAEARQSPPSIGSPEHHAMPHRQ